MAQVIRKYLEGGKTKPTIVKIDGKDYNYDDIERNVWGNFEAHAKANNWDAETQNAVRDYLEYSLAGLKSGELSYGHNKMNNVSLEYESDGTFNTKGKGLFKRDITNDKRAGATLGTAYYNTLFNNNVMNEYKAPELKNIGSSLTLDIAKKIMDNNYGGNAEAMQEGWYKLTPLDRYTIFRQALADLNYSADEYKDAERFNTKRANLLQLLENPYTDELNPEIEKAYAALGGYGLTNLLKGEAKTSDTDEIKAPTIEELRKRWRNEVISKDITDPAAIDREVAAMEALWRKLLEAGGEATLALKQMLDFDNLKAALEAYGLFEQTEKGKWYNSLGKWKRSKVDYNINKETWKPKDFSDLTPQNLKAKMLSLYARIRNGQIHSLKDSNQIWEDLSLLEYANALGGAKGDGQWKALEGSEDWNNNTVIAYDPEGNDIRIMSMYDFSQYRPKLSANWVKRYNAANGLNISEDFLQQLNQIASNKEGGILKAATGLEFLREQQLRSTGLLSSGSSGTGSMYEAQLQIYNLKRQAEIDEATDLGITVEELRKLKAENKKKLIKIDRAVKHGLSPVEGFTNYDWANIAGAGFDIVETVGSLTGGAADPITWVGGIGSLGSYLYADAYDPRVSKLDVAKNLGINLGISALGLVPGLGASAPIARTAKILTRFAPKLLLAFQATLTLPEAYNATKKLTEKGFSSLTNDELLAIARGIQTLSAGTRATVQTKSEFRASKPSEGKRTIELLNEQKGRFSKELTPEQYNKIKGKTATQAEEILGNDFLNGAHVAEGGRRYWLAGSRNPITTNEGTSWYSRNIGNRELKSIEEVKPNERRDWLRALGLPMNTYSKRFLDLRLNLHMPSWMPSFSRTRMSAEEFIKRAGLSKQTTSNTQSQQAPLSKRTQQTRQFVSNLFRTRFGQSLLEDSKLASLLKTIRIPQDGKRIVKKPTLLAMKDESTYKSHNLNEIVARLDKKTGTITWALKKNIPKSWSKYLLPLSTKVNTQKGTMTIAEAFAQGQEIKFDPDFLKHGGSIFLNNVLLKYQQGGSIPKYAGGNLFSNVLFGQGNNWRANVYDNIEADLLERLKNAKTLEEKKKIIDAYNNMLTKHSAIYSTNTTNGLLNNLVSFDLNTSDYQNAIIKDYDFVNTKGIKAQWKNGAYNTNYNRNVGKDGYGDSWDKTYAADGLYGGQTDDRRILGRKGDFDESSEDYKALVKRWQDAGADIYLDPTTNYYMLKLTNSLPTLGNSISLTHVDPLTGEEVQYDPNTGQFKAVGNGNPLSKTKVQTIGEDVLNYIKNINPADAIALGRALWGENVNNKVTELTKQMQTALLDPLYLTAILHGNYNAKMLAQELAGKINAAALKPISSDAGTNYAARLEAALKATQALQLGNAEDSEMYWKTLQILNLINNENAAQEVATGNENRSRVTAAYNNRLQAEAARLTANFEQIWQPFLAGVEKRYRDEDVLRRQAEIDNWKYRISDKYQIENDAVMKEYNEARNAAAKDWAAKHNNSLDGFYEDWAANHSPKYQERLKDISRRMYDELYAGLSQYYGYTPFQLKRTPAIEVPGINGGIYRNYAITHKSGGTLSAAERQALKTTNEINKNIRQAARETYKNIREDKREHRKAMALVSQLSADLIKKAVGIK